MCNSHRKLGEVEFQRKVIREVCESNNDSKRTCKMIKQEISE